MKKDQLKDKDLITKVLEGDTSAFKIIITNTQGLVIQIIYKMIRNSVDREDLAQDVYLKVYSKLSSFKYNSKLSTWIGTITYNTCINHLEKKKLPIQDMNDNEGGDLWETIGNDLVGNDTNQSESYLFNKERSQILSIEIEKLSPVYKTIITLFHTEELSYEEIAKITNLPEGTLKNYLFRARKKLRENLLLNYNREDL